MCNWGHNDQVLISCSIQTFVVRQLRMRQHDRRKSVKCDVCNCNIVHSKHKYIRIRNYKHQETSLSCCMAACDALIAYKCNDNMISTILMKANKTLWNFSLSISRNRSLLSKIQCLLLYTSNSMHSTVNRIGDASTSASVLWCSYFCFMVDVQI